MITALNAFIMALEIMLVIIAIIWIIAVIDIVISSRKADKWGRRGIMEEASYTAIIATVVVALFFIIGGGVNAFAVQYNNQNAADVYMVTGNITALTPIGGMNQQRSGFGGSQSSAYIGVTINNETYYYFLHNTGNLGDILSNQNIIGDNATLAYLSSSAPANQEGLPSIQFMIINGQNYTINMPIVPYGIIANVS